MPMDGEAPSSRSMLRTESTYFLLFASGLLGGFGHCIAMCGPLAASFSFCIGKRPSLLPHLMYNLGRVTTYSLVGGAAGVAGSILGVAESLAPLQKAVGAGVGLLIILMGLWVGGLLPLPAPLAEGSTYPAFLSRFILGIRESRDAGALFPLGMLLGLLPCGLVYAALLTAAREGMEAGSPAAGFIKGFLVMALFGAGTIPSLLLLGTAAGFAGARMKKNLYRASAVLLALAGALFVIRALRA